MKDILKQKEIDLNKRFDDTKKKAVKAEADLAILQEELIKIQGAFRLLSELILLEQKDEEKVTDI